MLPAVRTLCPFFQSMMLPGLSVSWDTCTASRVWYSAAEWRNTNRAVQVEGGAHLHLDDLSLPHDPVLRLPVCQTSLQFISLYFPYDCSMRLSQCSLVSNL